MEQVTIRRAFAADLDAVADLRWRWSVGESGVTPTTTPTGYREAVLRFAREHAATHRCWVGVRGTDVVAMAWIAYTPRPPTPDDLDRMAADVQTVYVVPELRGSGLGSRLMRTLLEDARKAGCRYVRVHSSDRAVPMYERAGFHVDERYRVATL